MPCRGPFGGPFVPQRKGQIRLGEVVFGLISDVRGAPILPLIRLQGSGQIGNICRERAFKPK